MTNDGIKVWIWVHNDRLYKAISNPVTKTVTIYDANDRILIRRTGLTIQQMKAIEATITIYGGRRMDGNRQPFTYL